MFLFYITYTPIYVRIIVDIIINQWTPKKITSSLCIIILMIVPSGWHSRMNSRTAVQKLGLYRLFHKEASPLPIKTGILCHGKLWRYLNKMWCYSAWFCDVIARARTPVPPKKHRTGQRMVYSCSSNLGLSNKNGISRAICLLPMATWHHSQGTWPLISPVCKTPW